MYVILVYDFGEKRVGKMLKLCRKYLNWIQNSVFEGEISEVKLKELLQKARLFMDKKEDSIILFKHPSQVYMDKEVIGHERSSIDVFLWVILNVDVAKSKESNIQRKKEKEINWLNITRLAHLSIFRTIFIIAHWHHISQKNTNFAIVIILIHNLSYVLFCRVIIALM